LAPNRRGGPRYDPCAPSGGSSHKTGQCNSGGGHGPDASPQVSDMGLFTGIKEGDTGANAPINTSCAQQPNDGPTIAGGTPGPELVRPSHGGQSPHGHHLPWESTREGGPQALSATLRGPTGPSVGAPASRSAAKPRHPLMGLLASACLELFHPREAALPGRAPLYRRDFPRKTPPPPRDSPEATMETDPDPGCGAEQGRTRNAPHPAAGPMEMYES